MIEKLQKQQLFLCATLNGSLKLSEKYLRCVKKTLIFMRGIPIKKQPLKERPFYKIYQIYFAPKAAIVMQL